MTATPRQRLERIRESWACGASPAVAWTTYLRTEKPLAADDRGWHTPWVPDDLWVCRRCIEDARARFFGLDDAPRPLFAPPGSYGKTVTCREYSEWFFADRRKWRMGGGLRTARSE
jgi:hypothetical protein